MSRRSPSEPAYGQIKLKCQRGHELGAILVTPRRPIRKQTLHRLAAVVKAPDVTKRPDPDDGYDLPEPDEIQTEGPVEWGMPVSADCEKCGRPYQTFWEMFEPAIAQLADKPVTTVTLYDQPDQPLC